jgi:fructosamine-3-kinase
VIRERFACCGCGQECKVVRVDFGIGPYEYWGRREVDVQMRDVSDCHQTEFTPYDDSPIDEEDNEARVCGTD